MEILNQKFAIVITCGQGEDEALNDVRDWLKNKLADKVENVYLTIGNFGVTSCGKIFAGQLLIRADKELDAATLKSYIETPADSDFRFEKLEKA